MPAPHGWRRSPLVDLTPQEGGRLRGPARLLARGQRRRLHRRRRHGLAARKHGLQANHVTAVEIVTADGELRRVDAGNDPDLFWAVRGGGANFGLVTAIEFDLIPLSELYAGALFFPFERSAEVLNAFREWTANGLPEEITSIGRTLQLPDLEIIPEIVRGKSFSIVEAAYLGDEAQGAELLEPLRELGPVMDTFAMVPRGGSPSCTWIRSSRSRMRASTRCSASSPSARSTRRSPPSDRGAVAGLVRDPPRRRRALARRRRPRRDLVVCGRVLMFGVAPVLDLASLPAMEADMARLATAFAPDETWALPQLHRGAPRRQRDVPRRRCRAQRGR